MVAYHTGSNPIEIGDLGSKVKVTVTYFPFFLHNSLLTSLLRISALLSSIKMKFSMSLRYTLGRFVLNFIKIEWVMTSLWRHLSFPETIVHISNSVEPTNFILGINIQQHNVHLMIKMNVTLTDDEGHMRRSKVTKNEVMVISVPRLTFINLWFFMVDAGQCVNRSQADCQCEGCYDMRGRVHAEFSRWVPSDINCPVSIHRYNNSRK